MPGFPGYQVSDHGRVRSFSRLRKGGILKPGASRKGYLLVSLSEARRKYHRRVSHLVLEAFVGPCPEGMQTCHAPNPNPADNRLCNLRWGTSRENNADKVAAGTLAWGERSNLAKLTADEVLAIRAACDAGERRREIGLRYGIDRRTVQKIGNRIAWRQLPESELPAKRDRAGEARVVVRIRQMNQRDARDLATLFETLAAGTEPSNRESIACVVAKILIKD